MPDSVLVTDFDGTLTRHDFYKLVRDRLLSRDTPDYWQQHREGRITHFEALRAIFASIRTDESEVLDILSDMELDPDLPQALAVLRGAGWEVVVTSAGCEWYIQRLLSRQGVSLPVYANPGRFVSGRGLLMSLPLGGKYFSRTLGIDKAAVVRDLQSDHRHVAFSGDGYTDIDAAALVPAHFRFARDALAEEAAARGFEFVPFERWSQIAEHLTGYAVT